MRTLSPRVAACLLAAATAGAGCRTAGTSSGRPAGAPAIVQPGAPGEASKVIGADAARDLSKVGATAADVKFMQGMIHTRLRHDTELLKTRTGSDDMKKLLIRVATDRSDDAAGCRPTADALDPHAMHMPGMVMPDGSRPDDAGMLTPEEMEHLASLKGTDFDRFSSKA